MVEKRRCCNCIYFTTIVEYRITYCSSRYKKLPVQPPVEVDKIWTITKTETAVIITCNDVEVLNYLFADSSGSVCVSQWNRDVDNIVFGGLDTASDFYRAGKLRFKLYSYVYFVFRVMTDTV